MDTIQKAAPDAGAQRIQDNLQMMHAYFDVSPRKPPRWLSLGQSRCSDAATISSAHMLAWLAFGDHRWRFGPRSICLVEPDLSPTALDTRGRPARVLAHRRRTPSPLVRGCYHSHQQFHGPVNGVGSTGIYSGNILRSMARRK
jgi:hypothetical protein